MATGLKLGYHTAEIVKVTESSYLGGIVTFYGFNYLNGAPAVPNDKDKSIWFIGDSITAGFGAEGPNTSNAFSLVEENVTCTYGFKTATALNANYRATAISGGGLVRTASGSQGERFLLPNHINNTHFDDANTEMKGYEEPDVIVVALGANDFASGLEGIAEEYVAGYHSFIDVLREKCPNAKIVCAINSYYTSAVTAVTQVVEEEIADGYSDVSLCVMNMDNTNSNYMGAANHPSASGHTVLSESLISHISNLMQW